MTSSDDLIEQYLDELLSRLRGPAPIVRRTLAEAEAHLRDATEAAMTKGMDEAAAQRAAVSDFGSAAKVARASNRATGGVTAARLSGELAGAAGRMLIVGLLAVGVSALLARGLAALTSTKFVFGLPPSAPVSAPSCAHWLQVQPTATTCQAAGTLENASDTLQFYLAAGILGLLLLTFLHILRVVRRSRRDGGVHIPALAGVTSAVGITIFGGTGLVLLMAAVTDAAVSGLWGAGLLYVDAAVSFAVAAGYVVQFLHGLLQTQLP